MKSIDGGASWTKKPELLLCDLEFKPVIQTIVYGSSRNFGDSYFQFRSINNGDSWTFDESFGRTECVANLQ